MSGPVEVVQGTDPWNTTPNVDPLPVAGPLTNAQLRATPLPVAATLAAAVDVSDRSARLVGIVALDAASLAALETIQVGSLPAVTLDAATLAALETIQVGSLPAVALDAATLAALETIQVGSLPAVALDAASLAALETIQVGSLPAVALDAATLAALETISVQNFPATQPVSGTLGVTQSTTPWKAREDTAAMTWVSIKSAAPSASVVQADTGALAAGDYDFDVMLLASDTTAVGKGLVIEHRNAANGATLQTLGGIDAPNSLFVPIRRYTIATNERLRVIAGTAAGAASSMYVSAIGRRVS